MPPKKKGAKKGNGKEKEKGEASGTAESCTVEVSVDQLKEQINLLEDDLDKEREDRKFFQMEGDKIRTFWDITKRQLGEQTADLRNRDRELEESEEKHLEDIQDYKKRVKHLLYEHQNSLSEQKTERTAAKKVLQTEHIEREFELRKEIRSLKDEIREMELSSENLVKKLKMKHDEEFIQKQNDFEKRLLEHKRKNEIKMLAMLREGDLSWTGEIHKIEERKNSQINTLIKDHDKALGSMKNYYTDTIVNNMSLIKSQKADIDAAQKKVEELEKENSKVMQQNNLLTKPLQKATQEVAELQKQMANFRKDKASLAEARKRLKAADKEMEEKKWECEILHQRLRKVEGDRDTLTQQLTNTILEVQQKSSFKTHLENELNNVAKARGKTESS
ncbi:dynein regulatory complex subunit 4 isoform X2 [Conger conger]|uniref:dynein regulatory complex subunit 4 isoform X2 n=1 Tax=Conger conger TaxID=82655 RepID=UPI002A59B215|nr:dynein regulatory complex subunit 4 isoform X2 [Conger conger]